MRTEKKMRSVGVLYTQQEKKRIEPGSVGVLVRRDRSYSFDVPYLVVEFEQGRVFVSENRVEEV